MFHRLLPGLAAMAGIPLFALGASAQFAVIRVGDIDGFGWGTGVGLQSACTAPLLPANVDTVGVLGRLDFLPDLDLDGDVGAFGQGENWDNRTGSEDQGTSVTGTGFSQSALTLGSQFTDITLSETLSGLPNWVFPDPPAMNFPDPMGPATPNHAVYTFDFHVATADIIQGQPLFLNAAIGDLDNGSPQVQVTPPVGPIFTRALALQQNLTAACPPANDGLIQSVTLPLDFNEVFIAEPGGWRGSVDVQFLLPYEPYTAFDYAEISTIPAVNACETAPSTLRARFPFDYVTSSPSHTREIISRLDGTHQAGSSVVAGGQVGGALSLDGIDDYVFVTANPVFEANGSGISFDAWVYLNPSGAGGPILSRQTDGPNQIGYTLAISGVAGARELIFDINDGVAMSSYVLDANAVVPDANPNGEWVHVAATLVQAMGGGFQAEFWINGVSSGFAFNGGGNVSSYPAKGGFLIGSSGVSYFDGLIDELEVYGRDPSSSSTVGSGILTLQQVQNIYESGAFGKCRCANIDNRLVAWWRADGNLDDAVLDQHDGIALLGGAGYSAGRVGQAFSLDGVDDAIQLSDVGPDSGSFAVDAWIRFTGTAAGLVEPILDKRSATGRGFFFHLANGLLALSLQDDNVGPPLVVSGGGSVADGLWHHVAAEVVRSGSPRATLYADGVSVAEVANPPLGSLGNGANMLAGSSYDAVAEFFEGQIDEIELWSETEAAGYAPFGSVMFDITLAGDLGKCDPAVEVDVAFTPSDGGDVFIGFGNQVEIAATINPDLGPSEVAGVIADAVNGSSALQALGVSAQAIGSRVRFVGGAAVEIRSTDTGFYLNSHPTSAPAVPVMGMEGWLLCALALLASGAGAFRQKERYSSR